MMKASYLGRFQIFHSGHLDCVKHIESQEDVDELVIIIGSSQYSRQEKHPYLPWILNPLTQQERKKMIEAGLKGQVKKPYEIITVPDKHICEVWIKILDYYAKPDVHYTNTGREIRTFQEYGIPTRPFPVGKRFHAHTIREMIAWDDGQYRSLVPEGVAEFIEKHNVDGILYDFFRKHSPEIELVRQMQIRNGIVPYEPGKDYEVKK